MLPDLRRTDSLGLPCPKLKGVQGSKWRVVQIDIADHSTWYLTIPRIKESSGINTCTGNMHCMHHFIISTAQAAA